MLFRTKYETVDLPIRPAGSLLSHDWLTETTPAVPTKGLQLKVEIVDQRVAWNELGLNLAHQTFFKTRMLWSNVR
jgi:hypothetical protein